MAASPHPDVLTMGDANAVAAILGRENLPWAVRASLRCWRPLPAPAWWAWQGVCIAAIAACAMGVLTLSIDLALALAGADWTLIGMPWMAGWRIGDAAALVLVEAALAGLFAWSGLARSVPGVVGVARAVSKQDIEHLADACQHRPWLLELMAARGIDHAGMASWRKGSVDGLLACAALLDAHVHAARHATTQASIASMERAALEVAVDDLSGRIEAQRVAHAHLQRLAAAPAASSAAIRRRA